MVFFCLVVAMARVSLYFENPSKILSKSSKNTPKSIKNHQKSRFGGVWMALGRGLGAMMAPMGTQELQSM